MRSHRRYLLFAGGRDGRARRVYRIYIRAHERKRRNTSVGVGRGRGGRKFVSCPRTSFLVPFPERGAYARMYTKTLYVLAREIPYIRGGNGNGRGDFLIDNPSGARRRSSFTRPKNSIDSSTRNLAATTDEDPRSSPIRRREIRNEYRVNREK